MLINKTNYTMMLGGLIAASCLILSACVTTPSLTPKQCQANNWQDIGYEDGVAGHSADYFGNHIENCTPVVGSLPNRELWEQGRQEGLKKFCTELSAYQLGRSGGAWRPVCPLDNIEKLEEAYGQGRYYYLRERDMNELMNPFYGPYHIHPFAHTPWGLRYYP